MRPEEPQNEAFVPESVEEQIESLIQAKGQNTPSSLLVRDLRIAYGEKSAEDQTLKRIRERLNAYIVEAQPHDSQEQRRPQKNRRLPGEGRDFHMNVPIEARHVWTRQLAMVAAVLITALVVGSLIVVLQMIRINNSHSGGTNHPAEQPHPTPRSQGQKTSPGMYVGVNNQLVKVDLQTKKVLWRFTVKPDPKDIPAFQQPNVNSTPTVVNGSVYFTAQNGRLYAVSALTGALLWQRNFQMYIGNIYVVNGILYTNTNWSDEHGPIDDVYALNPQNGATKIKYKTAGQIAAFINNILYLDNGNVLIAMKVTDGSQLWQTVFATTQQLNGEVHSRNGLLYLSSSHVSEKQANEPQDSYAYTLAIQSGKIIWQSSPMDGFVFHIAVDDNGHIYCGAQNHYVYAFDPKTKQQLWKYNTPNGYVYPAPIVQEGTAYVGQSTNTDSLIALNATTGIHQWTRSLIGYTGTGDNEPLVLHKGVIYLGTSNGLLGFSTSTGNQVLRISPQILLNQGTGVDGFISGMVITIVG